MALAILQAVQNGSKHHLCTKQKGQRNKNSPQPRKIGVNEHCRVAFLSNTYRSDTDDVRTDLYEASKDLDKAR